jgi:hypothetical protein
MSTLKDVIAGVREVLLLTSRVESIGETLLGITQEMRNYDRRLVRLETMAEMAQNQKQLQRG